MSEISKQFLDKSGVNALWGKTCATFSHKNHMHDNYLELDGTAVASNDLTGNIEASYEEFNIRQSANGAPIKDNNASIKNIYGNSVVYNQLLCNALDQDGVGKNGWWVRGLGSNGVSASINGTTISYNVVPEAGQNQQISQYVSNLAVGDKILLTFGYNNNGVINDAYNRPWFIRLSNDIYGNISQTVIGEQGAPNQGNATLFITVNTEGLSYVILKQPYVGLTEVAPTTMEWSNIKLYNLTKMFGAGYEPTTVEDFYQRLPEGIDINAYNLGEIINFTPKAIETTGLNQWDEEWELGSINNEGETYNTTSIISKKFNRILPNTTYHLCYKGDTTQILNAVQIGYWDSNKDYIDRFYVTNKSFTTPTNAAYFKISTNTSSNITTYNNDICINISCDRNGEYEPYKKGTNDLTWIKKYFQNGMKSAGNVRDEIRYNEYKKQWEAVQRIGEVDLGSLEWTLRTGLSKPLLQCATLMDRQLGPVFNAICAKYTTYSETHASAGNVADRIGDKMIAAYYSQSNTNTYIYVADSAYTEDIDIPVFTEAMKGVMLYYELANPIVTPITDIVDMNYVVYENGTEQIANNTLTVLYFSLLKIFEIKYIKQ